MTLTKTHTETIKEMKKIREEFAEYRSTRGWKGRAWARENNEIIGYISAVKSELEFLKKYGAWDDEKCRFDHHGYCQEHNSFDEGVCNNTMIKKRISDCEQTIKLAEDK